MPSKVTTTRFVCSVCERKHMTRQASEKCEKKGIAIPEFHQCQVVEYVGQEPRFRDKRVIVMGHAHRIYLKPTYIHEVPSLYEVCVGKELGWYARVRYSELRRIDDFSSDCCPVCASAEVFDSTREDYRVFTSLFWDKLPLLGTVSCKECPNCKRKFFTPEQFASVEKEIKLGIAQGGR